MKFIFFIFIFFGWTAYGNSEFDAPPSSVSISEQGLRPDADFYRQYFYNQNPDQAQTWQHDDFTPLPAPPIFQQAAMPEDNSKSSGLEVYAAFRVGGGSLSFDVPNTDDMTGMAFGGALGFIIRGDHNDFRIEAEVSRNSFTAEHRIPGLVPGSSIIAETEAVATTFMVNAYIDLMASTAFRPYVGFGIGVVQAQESATAFGITISGEVQTETVYGLYAGVGFDLSKSGRMVGDVGVRYLIATVESVDISALTFNAGLRIMF